MCLMCLIHYHMVDLASNKVLPSCDRSGVAVMVGSYIGGRCLIEAVLKLGTSTGEVSSFAIVKALLICTVLH
jgi:hypothetical protein